MLVKNIAENKELNLNEDKIIKNVEEMNNNKIVKINQNKKFGNGIKMIKLIQKFRKIKTVF